MNIWKFFGFGQSAALSNRYGVQTGAPMSTLIDDLPAVNVDSSMQISAVWRSVELISKLIATLPLMVYEQNNGLRKPARGSELWSILHDAPNTDMTPAEFWVAMLINLLLRGNGYARIERNANGTPFALWPMPADQVQLVHEKLGNVYYYRIGNDLAVLAPENVLHIKEMGAGLVGMSRLDYMRTTTGEITNAQRAANKLFSNGGKPTGVLMVDKVLKSEQRAALQDSFREMVAGSTQRLYVLEADMKFQQLNLSPEDMQLLSTRQFSIQEIGRWFGVPAILLNQTEGNTTLGSSSNDIIESFYKLTIRPMIVALEQALTKRVLNAQQRSKYSVEFNMDGLLRASLADRVEIYAKSVQNGIKTRNECRQLENEPPITGGDSITVQSNLVPIELLGRINTPASTAQINTIAQ